MPAPFRDARPKIEWDEVGVAKTPVGGWVANEVSGGWHARNWRYFGTNGGGNYLPFFGAPAVRAPSSWGPATSTPAEEEGVFTGDGPNTSWAVLGGWVDSTGIYPAIISAWAEKTFTGLTPGMIVGFTFSFGYVLDTAGGNVFGEIEGETINRFSALNSGPTFWTFDGKPVVDGGYISTMVPASGEVTVRLGWENMGPAGANGQGMFSAFELVDLTCEETLTTHELHFAYPLEEVRSWRQPREGSAHAVYPSGEESAWIRGHDGFLEGEVRWIPRVTSIDPLNNAWEVAGDVPGWQRFLAWARRRGNTFRFHPDADDDELFDECVLVEPRNDPNPEDDMTRELAPFRIRTVDGSLIEGY